MRQQLASTTGVDGDAHPLLPQKMAIADALSVSVRELFPERYDEDGNQLHAGRENSNSGARYR
jgi:lambda repressor-like predicted transcriptional regulator